MLINQTKSYKFAVDTYLVAIIIFNNIGNVVSCQAQTLSERETPITILVPTSNLDLSTFNNQLDSEFSDRVESTHRQIEVKKIVVSGNTLFQTEIDRLTKPFAGRSTNIAQLYTLRSAISKLYTEGGYVNSGAYLPPQKLRNGIVKVEVLEGGIETVEVTGNKRLSDEYIASRLTSIPTPIQTEKLLEQLQLLRLDPLIENVSAELSTGLSPGMSRLDIKVEEAKGFSLSSSLNNYNSPSIGSNSRNLGLTYNNLWGFGDRAFVNYTNTEGSNGLDFSYGFPINSKNGRIDLSYGFNSNDIVETPFTPLDIETQSDYYKLSWRQPIIAKPSQEVALGLSFSRQHSESSLLGESFPLSLGADESGNTNISALRFFQEFTKRDDNSVVAVRSQFSLGLDIFNATINEDIADGRFFAWRGQSQWVRQLDRDFILLLRGDIQLADNLLPLEQFRLGGANTVRGYRRDVSLSDSGLFTSAELRVPIGRIQKLDGLFQLVPFIDFGLPWSSDALVEVDSLLSFGMGLNFSAGERFNARLDYGVPLTDVRVDGDSLQENGLTFSLGHNF